MDNAQKAIMVGVGLFITIIIIAAVMLITGMGQNIINKGTAQIAGLSSQLENTITQEYDNKTLTGAQVRAAMQQYWTSSELCVALKSNSGTDWAYAGVRKMAGLAAPTGNNTNYTATGLNDFDTGSNAKTPQNSFTDTTVNNGKFYISTSATYKSYLVKVNNTTVGIAFVKVAN